MSFSFPIYLDRSTISELENHIIYIIGTSKTLEQITTESEPLWNWTSQILSISKEELRHQIENHEADEHFSDKYAEEKDHLLKLPLLLLENINSSL